MLDPDAWVPIAEVARPHGVRGELRLKLFNSASDVLLTIPEVLVRLPDGTEHEVSVDKARRADSAILIKLFSVDDRDHAEEIRGALVCVRRRDFPELDGDEFYACDVEGARAWLGEQEIGVVIEVLTYPSAQALLIRGEDGDREVPLVDAYVTKVDPAAGRVELASLEGVEPFKPKRPKAAASVRG